ncbi:hypothetical protein [Epilithonimonas sp. UC225_85]
MKKIDIVGGGFSGTMTAVQVIEKSALPFEIKNKANKNNCY